MRIALLALCAALFAPAAARADSAECRNLLRNVERFEGMAERAEDAGQDAYADHLREQVEIFKARREGRCDPLLDVASTVECDNFTRNIDHFEEMAQRAQDLGNPMWAEHTEAQVEALKTEREARCPEWSKEAQAQRAFMQLVRLAGRAAIQYFTFGAGWPF
jgi:hypothetical protein